MLRIVFVLLLPSFFLALPAHTQLQPLGLWREHLDFNAAFRVSAGPDNVYVASKFGVYSVSYNDFSIERFTKISGLSDVGVRTIKFDPASEKLLIAYNNSNLDLLYRNDIINIPYILRSNVSADKKINDIYFSGNKAYLSTNLGVIVVHTERYEISSTWYLGDNGRPVKVFAFCADENFFYAATEEGIKQAARNSNLEDYRNWATLDFASGRAQSVQAINGKIFAFQDNSVYVRTAGNWTRIYGDAFRWVDVNAGENVLLITEETGNWTERKVVVIDASTLQEKSNISDNTFLLRPAQASQYDNRIFIADLERGLILYNGTGFTRIVLPTPYGPLDGEMRFFGNTLYVAGGSINDAWNYQFNRTGFFSFEEDNWTAFNNRSLSWMDTIQDIITIEKDRVSNTLYAGSFGGGLIEYESPTKYKIYKQGTGVDEAVGDPNNYRIGGLATDLENNLWFSNFGATQSFGVKKADGNWKKFTIPFLIKDNMAGGILIDDFNQKWIQVPQGNGLFCFNHGNSIDNTSDDRWKWYQTGKLNGNLPGNFVNSMVKDKDGFIWLGTDKGIGIIQCPGEVFTSFGCEVFQPVVQQDNFAGLLFVNEDVRAIAVDGGNRKWVGTRNGVWLLSPDGDKVLLRFTAENSPLLSNEIIRIAIHPSTGEVFFSTFNGICSYRGTAIEANTESQKVLVYPNPVPSAYNGTIGIRDVPANAIVKITELNGRLVYQTRAAGGQAVWNGKDYTGRRPASGVYLILITDESGQEKKVGKILFLK
jgi:hypothetical protein